MNLNQQLEQIQQQMAETLPAHILTAFGDSLQDLIAQNLEAHALKVGDVAPNFTLPNVDGAMVSLYDALAKSRVILTFFRGNWCPFCMAELAHYQAAINDHNIAGDATVIAISPQTIEFNRAAATDHHLQFPLLADQGNQVAEQYGLVFTLQQHVTEIYKSLGADLQQFNGDSSYRLPIPATYVIDQNKQIIFSAVNTNYMTRTDICEINTKL